MYMMLSNIPTKILLTLFLLFAVCPAQAKDKNPMPDSLGVVSVKTNLLYDATTTLNLGVGVTVGQKWSIELPVNYNPWTFGSGRKIKHWMVQPALRYWTKQSFSGSFFGVHAHGGQYNIARIGGEARYQGWLVGGGLSYGYRWNWSRHWGMEAEIGLGYARLDYSEYATSGRCAPCGSLVKQDTYNYIGVTKAALSLVYTFGKKKKTPEFDYKVVGFNYKEPELDYITLTLPSAIEVTFVKPEPVVDTVYVELAPTRRHLSEVGRASVWFPVNKASLDTEMMQNRLELIKISGSMDIVRQDPSAKIERIKITAYSSPEGDGPHNYELSRQRAETLCRYMAETFGLPEDLFIVSDGGENWELLRAAIAINHELTATERADLARILDVEDIVKRKQLLKSYNGGRTYQWLLREIYPSLRVAEYEIEYSVEIKSTI
jgi:outer membrane protein OmpA-like peptidoglycan-associated protein